MPVALLPAGLPSQPHQGGPASFLTRFTRAVRSAITAGLARSTRQNTPKPRTTPPKPSDPAAPRAPRRASPATPAPAQQAPARPGWFARWFRRTPQPAPEARASRPRRNCEPFTAQTHPGLRPEVLAFLNTPVAQCDPMLVRIVLSVIAKQAAANMAGQPGSDAQALFEKMWARLAPALDQQAPDAPPAGQPQQAPAAVAEPAADAPPAAETAEMPAEPADEPAPEAAAPEVPRQTPRPAPAFHRRRTRPARLRPRRRRQPAPRCYFHSPTRRSPKRATHQPPPVRRLCYAACAGPP